MQTLIRILLYTLAILYLLMPFDLDGIPLIGRLDDIIVILAVIIYCKFFLPLHFNKNREAEPPEDAFDPYAVLGLPPNASRDQIISAYLKLRSTFEHNNVAQLGEDFQRNAEEKLDQVERAYRMLLAAIPEGT